MFTHSPRHILATCALMVIPAIAPAQTARTGSDVPFPAPAILEAGLAGGWHGALAYRDYQSDKMVELPVSTQVIALADQATILDISTFNDGPKRGSVIITTAYLFDAKAGTVENIALEKGRPIDRYVDSVKVIDYTDPTHWIIAYQHDGIDGKAPALIRTTEVRDGDSFASEEDVRPPDSSDKDWKLRNKTMLKRDTSK